MSVYLLHFDRPLKHAGHYVGWASHVQRRMGHHANGTGARLLQVLEEQGIGWTLARVWTGQTRKFERRVKKREWGPIAGLCPVCLKANSQPQRRLRTLRRERDVRQRLRRLEVT